MRHARLSGPCSDDLLLSTLGHRYAEIKLAAKGVAFYAGDAGVVGPGP